MNPTINLQLEKYCRPINNFIRENVSAVRKTDNPSSLDLLISAIVAGFNPYLRVMGCTSPEKHMTDEELAAEWNASAISYPAITTGSMSRTLEGWEIELQDACINDEYVRNDVAELFSTLCAGKSYQIIDESPNPLFPCSDGHYTATINCE